MFAAHGRYVLELLGLRLVKKNKNNRRENHEYAGAISRECRSMSQIINREYVELASVGTANVWVRVYSLPSVPGDDVKHRLDMELGRSAVQLIPRRGRAG